MPKAAVRPRPPSQRAATILQLLKEAIAAGTEADRVIRHISKETGDDILHQVNSVRHLQFWSGWTKGAEIDVNKLGLSLDTIASATRMLIDRLKAKPVPDEPDAEYYSTHPVSIGRLEIMLGLLHIADAETSALLADGSGKVELTELEREFQGYRDPPMRGN